jgi:two-component system, OmpR family, phosphate regulon sensor histidine kinase PhoR
LDELKLLITDKHLVIKEEHDEVPLIPVDPKLMRIVYQNLLTNAVKYTPNEGKIEITHRIAGDDVVIEIQDSGCGIPISEQPKIFSKLFRASNARQIDTNGTGLGLYIIKSIIEQASGKISFQSTENAGTTFRVEIPLVGMKAKEGSKPLV